MFDGIAPDYDRLNHLMSLGVDRTWRRRALREGKTSFLGLFGGVPEVRGETEWVAATDEKKRQLCLMMVNSKGVEETVTVRLKGHDFSVPSYR